MFNNNFLTLSLILLCATYIPSVYAMDGMDDHETAAQGDSNHFLPHILQFSRDEVFEVLIPVLHTQNPTLIHDQDPDSGNTSLHVAVNQGLEYTTVTLLNLGALCTIANKQGLTPLDIACKKDMKKENALGIAIICANNAIITENKQQVGAKSPFHHLMANETVTMHNLGLTLPGLIEQLVQSGYSINAQDEKGNTPAHYALIRNGEPYTGLLPLLKHYGADFEMQNKAGYTPSQYARSFKDSL